MTLRGRIEEARKNYDIRTILGTNKKSIICPLPGHIHENNTPSFSIFFKDGIQRFKCHGNCQKTGDVVDLMGYLHILGYDPHNPEMISRSLSYLERRVQPEIIIPEKKTKLRPRAFIKYLPPGPEAVEYAKSRGLNDATIMKFNLGQNGKYLSIPCFEDSKLIGIKMRNTTKEGIRFFAEKGSKEGLFNFDKVAYTSKPVLIVKGEIPAMLLDQMGYLVCAPTGGEGALIESSKIALVFARRIVVGDNDGPGIELGQKRAELLGAELVFPPEQYKDVDEWILADPNAPEIIDSWIEGESE